MSSNNDEHFRGVKVSTMLTMPILGITSQTVPPQATASIALDKDNLQPYYSVLTPQPMWIPFCNCQSSFGQFQSTVPQTIINLQGIITVNDTEVAEPSSDYSLNSGGVNITFPGWYNVWYSVATDSLSEIAVQLNGVIQSSTDYATGFPPVIGDGIVHTTSPNTLLQLVLLGPNVPVTISSISGDANPVQLVIKRLKLDV